jgi:hypothetical protein
VYDLQTLLRLGVGDVLEESRRSMAGDERWWRAVAVRHCSRRGAGERGQIGRA